MVERARERLFVIWVNSSVHAVVTRVLSTIFFVFFVISDFSFSIKSLRCLVASCRLFTATSNTDTFFLRFTNRICGRCGFRCSCSVVVVVVVVAVSLVSLLPRYEHSCFFLPPVHWLAADPETAGNFQRRAKDSGRLEKPRNREDIALLDLDSNGWRVASTSTPSAFFFSSHWSAGDGVIGVVVAEIAIFL